MSANHIPGESLFNFLPDFHGGWVKNPAAVASTLATMPLPLFGGAAAHLKGSGTNKTTLLYQAFKAVNNGAYIPYLPQVRGVCVGRGFAAGVDLLQAVQISLGNQPDKFEETSHEAIYGMSRVDIGGEHNNYQDGSVGAWAAKAVTTLGTVSREVTGPYSDDKAVLWGAKGVPADIKSQAASHKVLTSSLVTTYEQLEDALANGFPVTVASDQGFTLQRDSDGFCRARGSWAHNMLIVGVRNDTRTGACIFQSWGPDMPSGPLVLDMPSNSFWAERDTVSAMLACGDSWSLSNFNGYPDQSKAIDASLFMMI